MIRYTNKLKNTELEIEANYESSEQQNDQSPRGLLGLVLDYTPLAVIAWNDIGPILLDTLSNLT